MQSRREFLKGTAWMGAAAALAGCSTTKGFGFGMGGTMQGYGAPAIKGLRVGVIGMGRGASHSHPMALIPGTKVTAICDLSAPRIANELKWFDEHKIERPRVYTGSPEAWKALVDSPDVDLVINATPWHLHVPIALYAMRAGKHVAVEVPGAFTVDECWELVKTSEETRRHCMMMENCCYGETEMLALNLARQGVLGELTHGEGAYIHDLRSYCYGDYDLKTGHGGYWDYWRLKENQAHGGNRYPTHGLGPICQYMGVNRGDRFDYLVSVDSTQRGFEKYARDHYAEDSWKRQWKIKMGDMNTTIIKTVCGRTIMVQHDVTGPRPYSRLNLISGTKGILADYPYRIALEKKPGEGAHSWAAPAEAEKIRNDYRHPLWKDFGEDAKMGGHGGMDFMLNLRLSYCLQNGLPLDQDVYDLAAWSCLCELTERSADARGRTMDIPDFTDGHWKLQPPLPIESVPLSYKLKG